MMIDLQSRRRGDGCVSDLEFDRLLGDELEPAAATATRGHATSCAACGARLAELEVARREALPALASASAAARSASGAATRWWRRRFALPGLGLGLAVAAAASLVMIARGGSGDGGGVGAPGGTRLKGAAHLELFVAHDGHVRPAASGEVVAPGDRLQFAVTSADPVYVAVLSRDGAGQASIYFPDGDERAARVEAGNAVPLPRSTILDQVLGHENLYLLVCDQAIVLAPLVERVAASAAPPEAPPACRLENLAIEKRAP